MTQQISDATLIEGDPFSLRWGIPFTDQHPQIIDRDKVVSNPRHYRPRPSHACRRGYVAGWAINSGRLYLARLQGKYELKSEEPLFANWVSTVRQFELGHVNPALGNPYEPVFEAYLEFEFVEGIVTRWCVSKGRELSARILKNPPWQEGFDWPAVKDFIRASGVKFRFEMTEADRPERFWMPLKELALEQGFLTLADIASFLPIEEWNSGDFPGAYYLLKWLRTFEIEIRAE
jgi:hypothetical protein